MGERRRGPERTVKIPVGHCIASGGNGHFIILGEYVRFDSLDSYLDEVAEEYYEGVRPLIIIEENFSHKNPCIYCAGEDWILRKVDW